VKVELSKIDMM